MIEKYTLDNGIQVICEEIDFFKTFSLGFWVKAGSSYESPPTNGFTHLLEHMLFKGTHKRSYLDISTEIDSAGGHINAFTGRENTCFYVNLMNHHLDLGLDILNDMITNSILEEAELEKEKKVVIEEIKMYDDSPEELIHDLFFANIWKNHPLGYSILGNISNIQNVSRQSILSFFHKYYYTNNIVISIAGRFDQKRLIKQIEMFSYTQKDNTKSIDQQPIQTTNFEKAFKVKKLEQVYFIIGFQAFNRHDPRKYALYLLNTILGGGSSSRLFLEVREKLGLCYSIYSYHTLFHATGVFGIGSSTSLENYPLVLETIIKQIQKLTQFGITEKELHCAKEQIKGNIIFSQENLESHMNRNANNELNYKRDVPYEEILLEINKVTVEDINQLGCEILNINSYSFFSLGPVKHTKLFPHQNIDLN